MLKGKRLSQTSVRQRRSIQGISTRPTVSKYDAFSRLLNTFCFIFKDTCTVQGDVLRGGFKKFEEKCCQICNCLRKFTFSVHFVN